MIFHRKKKKDLTPIEQLYEERMELIKRLEEVNRLINEKERERLYDQSL